MTLSFSPRPSQKKILRYQGGRLGISAVPGAGKTFTLSALAAQIITRGQLASDQEVLIVTLVNTAVDNFSTRIGGFVQQHGLIPQLGYRVRTLHGLAHDIVREKPGRVGLEERFGIIDEREANLIRREAANAWLASHPYDLDSLLDPAMDDKKRDWVRGQKLPEIIESVALAFIRSAKDHRLSPSNLRQRLDAAPAPLPLAEMGCAIYSDYERALAYRGAVDFDDLIRLALDLLENDPEFLERLRYRFPYILEDEAQDSSELQERILGLLAGPSGNWVRVGDPNQAIFETFTTASPELLKRFIRDYPHVDMPESGRCQPAIIDLANHLIDWTAQQHPNLSVRSALTTPHIKPAPMGDPQPNPENDPQAIRFIARRYTPEEETEAVAKSIEKWLPDHSDWTCAVLAPRNARGTEVIEALKKRGVEVVEFLSSTSSTRAAAGALGNVLSFLSDPQSSVKLSKTYKVWRRDIFGTGAKAAIEGSEALREPFERVAALLRKCAETETFLAPDYDHDWLAGLGTTEPEEIIAELENFRPHIRRWLEAVTLPIDQLILTLAQDLFVEPSELALSHKLALVLGKAASEHPDWRLPELTAELAVIAKNERKFIGFSADDSGFDPQKHRGKVVVTTMHKAKGLEWDRVYLMSVNNYDFPSNMPGDTFISEKWFIASSLNLEAEALGQLKALVSTDEYTWYEEGAATVRARSDYVRERLRLLYVGITRAKRDLILTWNSGRQGESTPAVAFAALQGWLEGSSLA